MPPEESERCYNHLKTLHNVALKSINHDIELLSRSYISVQMEK